MQGSEMYGGCHMSVGWEVYSAVRSGVVLVVDLGVESGGYIGACHCSQQWQRELVGYWARYVRGM